LYQSPVHVVAITSCPVYGVMKRSCSSGVYIFKY